MKAKAFDLMLTFMTECKHAWERIEYMYHETDILNIRYRIDKKLWYIYLPTPVGISPTVLIITDEGHTIYLDDCIDRLEWNGGSDKRTAWNKVTNDEPTWDMVNALMLEHNF